MEDLKLSIDGERKTINEEKLALELKASSLSAREEVNLCLVCLFAVCKLMFCIVICDNDL